MKGFLCGENHWNAKLDDSQVIQIRELYEVKNFKITQLSKIFGTSWNTISDIVKYKVRTKPTTNRVQRSIYLGGNYDYSGLNEVWK